MKTFHILLTCLRNFGVRRSAFGVRRLAFGVAILLSLLLLPTPPVHAVDVFIQLETAADLDEIVTPYLDSVPRRRLLQGIGFSLTRLVATPEREVLGLHFYGWLETDFARDVVPSSADPREAEAVDFVLQRAYLDFTPADWILVRGGRHVLYSPTGPVDVDGASVDLRAPIGLFGRVGGGREVRSYIPGVDGDLYDLPGARWNLFGDGKPDTSWLVQADLGWSADVAQIDVGHRVSFRHGDRVAHLTGLLASLQGYGLRANVGALFNHLMASPDRLDVRLNHAISSAPIQIWLSWRYLRPTFDGDSIFTVFAVTPSVEWSLGADWRTSTGFGASVEGRQRAFDVAENVPWSGGFGDSEAVTRGLVLRGWAALLSELSMRASFAADGGYGGLLLNADLATLWDVIPNLFDLGLRLGYLYRESDVDDDQRGHQLVARGQGSYRLSSFGVIRAYLDYISDYRSGQQFRFMAEATFDLGPI